jgi:hypothetical protein
LPAAIAIAAFVGLAACGSGGGGGDDDSPIERRFDFQSGPQGFTAGFADYPIDQEEGMELDSGWEAVPPDVEDRNGFMLTGKNTSDDLFMFIKRQVTGLTPGTLYDVTFEVELATAVGENCPGIGGSPGESVFVKAGLTPVEPEAVDDGAGFLLMNIDKGNQSSGGSDAIVIGDMAGTGDCSLTSFELKTEDSEGQAFSVMTDDEGGAWLLVGTDSGHEGPTRVYFTRIRAQLRPRG